MNLKKLADVDQKSKDSAQPQVFVIDIPSGRKKSITDNFRLILTSDGAEAHHATCSLTSEFYPSIMAAGITTCHRGA